MDDKNSNGTDQNQDTNKEGMGKEMDKDMEKADTTPDEKAEGEKAE
jgi:hypothetical protein